MIYVLRRIRSYLGYSDFVCEQFKIDIRGTHMDLGGQRRFIFQVRYHLFSPTISIFCSAVTRVRARLLEYFLYFFLFFQCVVSLFDLEFKASCILHSYIEVNL